jgi:hypothetical protein
MIRVFDVIADNMPAIGASGTQVALGVAGATGQIPEGIHPIVWVLLTLVGPPITAIAWRAYRVRDARKMARLRAHAEELRRCALEHEALARGLLLDADSANDAEALKLHGRARQQRIEAAADDGEAAQIEAEMQRR